MSIVRLPFATMLTNLFCLFFPQSPLLFDGISVVCFGKFNGAISRGKL